MAPETDEVTTPEEVSAEPESSPPPALVPTPATAGPAAAPASAVAPTPESLGGVLPESPAPSYIQPESALLARRGLFAEKLAQALDKNPIQMKPNGKPVPGGWARSILASAQGVLSGLADLPTQAPNGAPITSGLAQAARNRQARVQAAQDRQRAQAKEDQEQQEHLQKMDIDQKRAQLDLANANIQFQHEQGLWHTAHEVQPNVDAGKMAVETLMKSPRPAEVAAEGLTSQQVKQGVIDGKWNTHDYTAFATGIKTDPETGWTRATYSVLKPGGPVKLDDDQVKYLNEARATDQPLTSGQEFTASQFNQAWQTASNFYAAKAAANKTVQDNKLAAAGAEAWDALKDPGFIDTWNKSLNRRGGNPIAAYADMIKSPEGKKYAYLLPDIQKVYGGEDGWKKQLEEYDTAMDRERAQKAAQLLNMTAVPLSDDMIKNINALHPDQKAILVNAAKGDNALMATLYTIAQNDGTVDIDKIFPNRVYKGATTMPMQDAIGVVKQLNPKFDENNYRSMMKIYADLIKDPTIGQFNNVMQHAGELSDTLAQLNTNKGPAWWNTQANKMGAQAWGTDAPTIEAAMEPLRDEFELLMSGGYKPSEDMKGAYQTIMNLGSTPGQISAALKKLVSTGSIRLGNIDADYYRKAGKHIPQLVTPDSLRAAQRLGIPRADAQTWSRLQSLAGGTPVIAGWNPNDRSAGAVAPGPLPATPTGVPTSEVYVGGKLVGHVIDGKYVALPPQTPQPGQP